MEVGDERKANAVVRFLENLEQMKKARKEAEQDMDAIDTKREQHNVVYQERRQLT